MKKYRILNNKNAAFEYTYLIEAVKGKSTYKKVASLGNSEKLKKINEDYLKTLRLELEQITWTDDPKEIKKILLQKLSIKKTEYVYKNDGITVLYDVIKRLRIYDFIPKTRHKNIEAMLEYQIASRILNNDSVIKRFNDKDAYTNDIEVEKSTFYNFLDILDDYQDEILKGLNNKIAKETNRNVELVFYDSSTVYFESFVREGLRVPGYSKDGKFKEDQVVIGMATDENGIPIMLKVFRGNTADCNTFIPFIVEMKKTYNLKKVTIIADKGMSINRNIRFLEANGIDFIISYRLKTSSKEFKEFALNKLGYKEINSTTKYKEYEYNSHWNGKRVNENVRRRIITHSTTRAKKDNENRKTLINNFIKRQNSAGIVTADNIIGIKKYKFYKKVRKMEFILDYKKILEDENYDGFYVYETSRLDLKPADIIEIYHKQWQIEENFRTLKNALSVRPVYVWTDKHIRGHFILNFIALIVLKYSIYLINKEYEKNGVITKMTNNKFIDILNSKQHWEKNVAGTCVDEGSSWPAGEHFKRQIYNEIKDILKK
ncbi:IS1634 family transposase [Mycoplasma phocimorsus]|uniref:IS1634 family transposase n=3 Tax=Mycoplasma phocimorsus TaxID=3045839 RepID=UPI0024BF979E|nr:IS1634 family transposase [Mycoplasma phocimorsus]